jgi:hypothetical protein
VTNRSRARSASGARRQRCPGGWLLLLGAAAVLLGCGSPRRPDALPPAGSPGDDGRGVLAKLTVGPGQRATPRGEAGAEEPEARPRSRYSSYQFGRVPRARPPILPYGDGYQPVALGRSGVVVGSISGAARKAEVRDGCGTERGGGAVVYLEGITRGRAFAGRPLGGPSGRLQIGGALELGSCGWAPRVQLAAPIGAGLTIVNGDAAAHRIEVRHRSAGGPESVDPIELAAGAIHDQVLDDSGWFEVRQAEGRRDSAWIVTQPHPYFALTDERGGFRLDEVPPGSHELVVWIAPGFGAGGAPVQLHRRVVVRPGQVTRVALRIPDGG